MIKIKKLSPTVSRLDWFIISLIGLFVLGHLLVALTQPFMGDEILSIFFANSYSFSNLISHQLELVHPNTYYLLVKLLLNLGLSTTGLRLVSFTFFLCSLLLWYYLAKTLTYKLSDRLIFTLFWAGSPYILRFSYLVRMYGTGFIFALLSIILILKWVKSSKSKYFLYSTIADVLGTLFVFGYILLPLTKLITFFIFRYRVSKLRKLLPQAFIFWAVCILVPVWHYYSGAEVLLQKFLWWVPATKLVDVFLALPALLGLAGFGYFEAHTPLTRSLILLGLFTVIGLSVSIVIAVILKNSPQLKSIRFNQIKTWMLRLCCIGALVYLLTFTIALLSGWRIFHIRQLYVIAIFFLWGVGLFIVILRRINKPLFAIGLIGMVSLFVRPWLNDYLPPANAYPQFYTTSTNKPVIFGLSDVELAFDQCQAYSYQDMVEKCPPQNRYFIQNSQDLTQLMVKLQSPVTVTSVIYLQSIDNQLDWLTCEQTSPEFYDCQINYEYLINRSAK
jgi:hypothetical protein